MPSAKRRRPTVANEERPLRDLWQLVSFGSLPCLPMLLRISFTCFCCTSPCLYLLFALLLRVPQIVRTDLAAVWRVQHWLDEAPTPVLRCLAGCISARPFKDISAVTWLAFVLGCSLHGMSAQRSASLYASYSLQARHFTICSLFMLLLTALMHIVTNL
jgi:hypothetical protein